jgi:hypothetical protein
MSAHQRAASGSRLLVWGSRCVGADAGAGVGVGVEEAENDDQGDSSKVRKSPHARGNEKAQ